MPGFFINIEEEALTNEAFREVLFTTERTQLVAMSLRPGEEIGREIHADADQFIRVESGQGKVILEDRELDFEGGDAVVIPAGTEHNVINTSDEFELKLYTLYAPPQHAEGTVHLTKAEALEGKE